MSLRNKKMLVIALILCIVSAVFSNLIQRDFGNVRMEEIKMETAIGTLAGYLLIPENVSIDHPAPGIVVSHGYLNNKEMQDISWIELSRRGYVVFAMDAYGHGDSSVPLPKFDNTINKKSAGMVDAVEYISSLPYVDSSRIGVAGHSMGGEFTNMTIEFYSNLERDGLKSGLSEEEAHALNKIASAVIMGNFPANLVLSEDKALNKISAGNVLGVPSATVPKLEGYLCDLAIIGGQYDEFFGRYLKNILSNDTSHELVKAYTGLEIDGDIENGMRYINPDNGYSLSLYQAYEFHAMNHFSLKTVGYLIDHFEKTLGESIPIESSNQIWWLKELMNFIGLIGFFMMIVPLTDMLLCIPYFKELRANGFTRISDPDNKLKRRFVWTGIVSGIISSIIIVPAIFFGYLVLKNSFWPQDTTAGIGLWATLSGLVSLLILKVSTRKKLKESSVKLNHVLKIIKFIKTLLLALTIVFFTYLTVFLANYFFKTDFRLWVFCIRVFSAEKIIVGIKYLPLYCLYFVASSFALRNSNFIEWSEKKQLLITSLLNVIAPMIVLVITYFPVIWTGQVPWSVLPDPLVLGMALITITIIPLVPILIITTFISFKLNKVSGEIWLGVFVNTLLVTMITVANTAFLFPY